MMLKKELTLLDLTLSGVGIIVGVGIYVLIGEAAGIVWNGVWISFLIGSLVAFFTLFSYAELSQIFPKAGAEYVYVKNSFGNRIGFLIGWLIVVGGCFASATVSLGFAGYFSELFGGNTFLIALILIVVCTAINIYGIKQSAQVAVLFSLIEVLGLLIIVFISIPKLGSVNYFYFPSFKSLISGAALIFFAFLGFEAIPRLAEESKRKELIPKAMILSLAISTAIYVLVSIAAISVINWKDLSISKAPLAEVAKVGFGKNAYLILSLIALFATSNTVLMNLVVTSRILYGMKDIFPSFVGEVHKKRKTPYISALIIGFISAVLLFFDIGFVANSTNFTVFITFIAVNAAAIYFRRKGSLASKKGKKIFSSWKGFSPSFAGIPIFPVFGIASSIFLILGFSLDIILGGLFVFLLGLGVYEVLNRIK
jgi:APA family basic amino acid/polyamine antiporter